MIFESPPIITPAPIEMQPQVMAPSQEAPAPPSDAQALTAEQIKAAEALFAAKDRESQQVAALLGLWTSAAILNDLAKETFSNASGEIESEKLKVKPEEHD